MSRKPPQKQRAENDKKLKAAERRKIVAEELMRGLPYREIAKNVGVSAATITQDFKAIMDAWRDVYAREIDEWVRLQLARADKMIDAMWDNAMAGDEKAVDRVIKLMEHQERLLGIGRHGIDITTNGDKLQRSASIEDVKAVIDMVRELESGALDDDDDR